MARQRLYMAGVSMVLVGLVAGCGGGGDGAPAAAGPVVSGGAVKGPLAGATVCAYQISNGVKGAALPVSLPTGTGMVSGLCYVTGADGSYGFSLPPGTSGDVLIESSGGRFCSNESQVTNGACAGGGTLVSLAATDTLSGVVALQPAGSATLFVTPLTTAAVAAAGNALTSVAFNTQFNTLAGSIGVDPATVTPATAPTATNHPYLSSAAQQVAGGAGLSSVVQTIQNGASGGAGGTTPATVNAALVGSYSLRFQVGGGDGCGTACNFADGQEVPVTVYADGRLSLPGKTLTNPFYRSYGGGSPHLPEIIWLDADAKVEYALSDNETGTFNEINVGDASQPQGALGTPRFLGQIRKAAQEGSAIIAPLAGTYALGSQYYGAAVAWTAVTIGTDGAVSFTGTGPDITRAQVAEIFDRTGCCNRVDITVNFDLNNDGSIDGSDKIALFTTAGGALQDMEYQLNANYSQRVGVRLGAQAALPAHGGTVPAPQGNAVAAVVGDATVSVASTESQVSGTLNAFSLVASQVDQGMVLQKQFVLQFAQSSALQQGQTLDCRRGVAGGENLITYQPSANATYSSDFGGRCTMTISTLVVTSGEITEIGGTFVAELGDFKHQLTVVKDGVFHWVKPVP